MITAVILTRNNERDLNETLRSLTWCNELLVIDDFSTDKTLSVVKTYYAVIYQRSLNMDFASQRNFALEKAKGPARNALPAMLRLSKQAGTHSDAGGDWVLFVDSDEIVSKALQKEIQETISQKGTDKEGIVGYFLKREDIFFGKTLKHGETAHVKLLRLARKNAGKWIRPVHEYWDVRGPTRTLANPLLHFPHTNVAQFIKQINFYTTINADYLHSQKVRSNIFSIFAYPLGKFFQNYFLRAGFLDGTSGFIMAMMMSFHSFLTRSKLYMKNDSSKKPT